MKKSATRRRGLWFAATLLGTALAAPSAHALVFGVRERTCQNGQQYQDYYGGTYTGDLSNPFAPFRVVIPKKNGQQPGWNGKLLAYARGTGSSIKLNAEGKALDVDGNVLLDPAKQAPLLGFTALTNALPEITATGLVLPGNPDAFEEELVCARKYAAVSSDYKPDLEFFSTGKLGWVVEDGTRDIGAAILQARRLLLATYGQWPKRTILMGRSQGSLISQRYAEERSPLVDGVVSSCTVGAGASRSWDSAIDFALAIDVAFGGPNGSGGWPWGKAGAGDVAAVRPDVAFSTDVLPVLLGWFAGQSPQSSFVRMEFVRLITGLPGAGFYPFPHPVLPNTPGYPQFNWLASALLFATEVKADVEARAGGAVGGNKDHGYSLSAPDRGYLQALLVNSGVPADQADALLSGWLAAMNARRNITASDAGKRFTANYHDFRFDGWLLPHPMLSIHTTTDGLVLPSQETEFRETLVAAKGAATVQNRQLLRQSFVEANGHCVLTQAEWTRAIEAMEYRLDRGVWPGSSFWNSPPSPIPGHDGLLRFNDGFNPGQYPQPPQP